MPWERFNTVEYHFLSWQRIPQQPSRGPQQLVDRREICSGLTVPGEIHEEGLKNHKLVWLQAVDFSGGFGGLGGLGSWPLHQVNPCWVCWLGIKCFKNYPVTLPECDPGLGKL